MLTYAFLRRRLVIMTSIQLTAVAMLALAGCDATAQPSGGSGTSASALSMTLSPAEAERVAFEGKQGETWVFQATVRSEDDDVAVVIYDNASRALANSPGGPGEPANVRLTIDQSGQYFVEVVNHSADESVSCQLTMQSLPANSAVASPLNGLYRIVELGGEDVPAVTQEKWLFADGLLVSRYVQIDGSLFGLPNDFEIWVNYQTGTVTETHYAGIHVTVRASRTTTTIDGSSVHLEIGTTTTETVQADIATYVGESTFDGRISSDGDVLEGVVESTVYVNNELNMSLEASVMLERENAGGEGGPECVEEGGACTVDDDCCEDLRCGGDGLCADQETDEGIVVRVTNNTAYPASVVLSGVLEDAVDTVVRTVGPSSTIDVDFVCVDEVVVGDPTELSAAGVIIDVDGEVVEVASFSLPAGEYFACGDVVEVVIDGVAPDDLSAEVYVLLHR